VCTAGWCVERWCTSVRECDAYRGAHPAHPSAPKRLAKAVARSELDATGHYALWSKVGVKRMLAGGACRTGTAVRLYHSLSRCSRICICTWRPAPGGPALWVLGGAHGGCVIMLRGCDDVVWSCCTVHAEGLTYDLELTLERWGSAPMARGHHAPKCKESELVSSYF